MYACAVFTWEYYALQTVALGHPSTTWKQKSGPLIQRLEACFPTAGEDVQHAGVVLDQGVNVPRLMAELRAAEVPTLTFVLSMINLADSVGEWGGRAVLYVGYAHTVLQPRPCLRLCCSRLL